ncbi:MAG TPA: hypothetical protein VFL83_03920 [Anaeromyxobacter sp.]|nr:hypothetical protein [Anaeromyxobacter sp.]
MRWPRARSLLAAAALLAPAACQTPEQKLADRRRELREVLDPMYAAYSAPPAPGTADAAGEREGGLVGRIMGELGRAAFEQHCLATGRGERPFAISGRLEAFVSEPANARACRRAADLQLEIDALERDVAAARAGT